MPVKNKTNILLLPLIAILIIAAVTTGCGIGQKPIPYPDTFYIPRPEAAEEGGEQEAASSKEKTDTHEGEAPAVPAATPAEPDSHKEVIRFFLDTSGSMNRSPEVILIHAASTKGAAGYKSRAFYALNDSGELVETTEELALSGAYAAGAPLDLVEKGTLPFEKDGVNILTTDLQSYTSCSRLGQWLVNSGCTGYTFYVFNVTYTGSLEFRMYTSRSTLEDISIGNCTFPGKEFLMIVFGNNRLVEEYDKTFQEKLRNNPIRFDMCHVSLNENTEDLPPLLKLRSSRCFAEDVANVSFSNTNWVFGLQQIEPEDVDFTCENTFVYRKSRLSSHTAKEAVKAVLYAIPDDSLPAVDRVLITGVQEYDSKTGTYKESTVSFSAEAAAWLDGMPSVNEQEEADTYEYLDRALGGPVVESGPVLSVSIWNDKLPSGLYAAEGTIVFHSSDKVRDLKNFGSSHSAGLEDYRAALITECEARQIDGQTSTTRFLYTGNGISSVFSRLLEFEKVTDELIAAGAVAKAPEKTIDFRLIIDNR